MLENNENKRLPRLALRLPRLTRTRAFAGIGCLLAGVIAVNATLFQTEKHPAPMFRQLAKPAPVASALPVPPLRPDIRETAAREAAPAREKPALREPEVSDIVLTDIQTELGRRGFYKGEVDGKPGPGTTKAIRDFQSAQRLPVDGMASEDLLATIRAQRHTMKDELLDLVKKAGTPEKAGVAALAGAAGATALALAARKAEGSRKAEGALAPKKNPAKTAAASSAKPGAKAAPAAKATAGVPATTRTATAKTAIDKATTAKTLPAKGAQVKAVPAKAAPVKAATKAEPARTATSPLAPRKLEAGFDSRPVPPLPVAEARDLRARR